MEKFMAQYEEDRRKYFRFSEKTLTHPINDEIVLNQMLVPSKAIYSANHRRK